MPPSHPWAAAAVASSSVSQALRARMVGRVFLRRSFVTAAITRSPLRRRGLFPSELLLPSTSSTLSSLTPPTRPASTATASTPSQPPPPGSTPEVEGEVEGKSPPDPSLSFQTIANKIHKNTLRAITVAPFKYTHMSAVQAQILPLLPHLARPYSPRDDDHENASERPRDLLVKAKTGTGKTMAFLVPAIEARLNAIEAHVAPFKPPSSPYPLSPSELNDLREMFAEKHVGALIISPTRELATQIAVEASNLTAHHRGFQVQVFLGGESKGRQLREFKGRKDIVVATPGRLLDLINSEPRVAEAIKTCNLLILDEADTLLDMGFRDDIERLTSHLPPAPERQTFLFSATVSRAIQQIAQATLSPNHRFVNCVSAHDSPVHAHIPQYHTVLRSGAEVFPHLLRLIAIDQLQHRAAHARGAKGGAGGGRSSKVVVFLSTTNSVILFSQLLRKARAYLPFGGRTGIYEMHAKRDMKVRTRVSSQFRADTSPSILITSDVSARGVDYPGVTRVIQLGVPSGRDIYIHRVGRTGRGTSRSGRGDLVVMPWEMDFVRSKLRDVGLKPVTAADTIQELAELASSSSSSSSPQSSSPQNPSPPTPPSSSPSYSPLKATELPSIAAELTSGLAQLAPDDVLGAFASQLGFFIGKYRELGLDIDSVARGLQSSWREMWALEREPVISRKLMDMMRGGAASASGGGWGRRDSGGDRGRRDRDSSWGGGAGAGQRRRAGTPYTIQGTFSSRNAPGGNDGYGYAKGSRQGLGNAQRWARTRESEWERGGAGGMRGGAGAGAGAGAGGFREREGSAGAGGWAARRSAGSGSGSGGFKARPSWEGRGSQRGRDMRERGGSGGYGRDGGRDGGYSRDRWNDVD